MQYEYDHIDHTVKMLETIIQPKYGTIKTLRYDHQNNRIIVRVVCGSKKLRSLMFVLKERGFKPRIVAEKRHYRFCEVDIAVHVPQTTQQTTR